ncbi:MAG: restriction endonuclease subunit S [Bryobacterales bacterium]|nr:restriction endonuclease subunit S [Bryobacterales bacterium]
MPEMLKQTQLFRFDQMAVQVKDKIDNPAEADVDRYVGLEHIDPESLKIRRWGETTDVESSKIIFKSGDIIFGKRRAYQRKLAVADFDGICSAHAMVLRPKTHVVIEEFLPFFMQSDIFMDRAVKISVGGLSPTINWSDIAKEEFALPPLEEQQRIAEVLLRIEATIARLLEVASSGYAALESCRDTWFGISKSSTSTLGRLCERGSGIQIGPFGAQLHQSDYRSEGVPVVMPSDLGDNSISMDQIAKVSPEKADQLSQHRLHIGDIILPRRGDLSRRALVSGEHEGWLCGTGCLRIRLDDVNLAQAVVQSLSSASVIRWLKSRAVGTTMPNLNSKIVAGVPVHFPERACDALVLIDQLTTALESTHARIAKLRRTRSSLLLEAFQ